MEKSKKIFECYFKKYKFYLKLGEFGLKNWVNFEIMDNFRNIL